MSAIKTLCGRCGKPRTDQQITDDERRAVAAGVPLNVFRGVARFRNDPLIVNTINKRLAELAQPAPAPDLGTAITAARNQTPESRKATLLTTLSQHSQIGQAPTGPTVASAPAPAPGDLAGAIASARK